MSPKIVSKKSAKATAQKEAKDSVTSGVGEAVVQNAPAKSAKEARHVLSILNILDQVHEHWQVRMDLGVNHLTGQDANVCRIKLNNAILEAAGLDGSNGHQVRKWLLALMRTEGTLQHRAQETKKIHDWVYSLYKM